MTPEPIGGLDVMAAYDTHGAGLYEYAHTLLQEDLRAADAVVDTLVAARHHHPRLREPELLRGWLYALLRTDCLRRGLSGPASPPAGSGSGADRPDDDQPADEAQLVVMSALRALPGEHREIIDLFVRHELSTIELDRVLGLPPGGAVDVLARASAALEEAVAAIVVARADPPECAELGPHSDVWPIPVGEVRRLVRHVWSCPICRDERPGNIQVERLLELLPFAQPPEWLRPEVFGAADDESAWVGPLDERGWPFTLVFEGSGSGEEGDEASGRRRSGRGAGGRRGARGGWAAIAVVGVAVAILGGLASVALSVANPTQQAANSPQAGGISGSPSSGGSSAGATPGSTPKRPSASPSATPSPSATHSPTPTPTPSTSKSHAPVPPTHSQPPPPGTLEITSCAMQSGEHSCTITVHAMGGPVSWSISGTSSGISASGSGSLSSGESAGVVVTRRSWCLIGSGSGSVYFDSGTTAQVDWQC